MFNNNTQFFQENPEFQRHAAWNPYQQGPLQHPQHQDPYPRWPIYQQQQPHQYQHQMYHQQVEQERHRQLQMQHHQQLQQQQRLEQEQRRLQEHQQGPQLPQHPQPHHQQQHQQHPQHHLPAQPQQEHNQFYPQPQAQPQPQEPSQPHQQQQYHQQVQHRQQQRQIQEQQELDNFNKTHQVIAPQQPQHGVRDQAAHQPHQQLDQDDNVEMLIEIDEDIEEIIFRAGPSNQANEDLPPQQKSEPACCEKLREKIRQDATVIESLKKEVEELKKKVGAFHGHRTIKVEVEEGTGNNAQQSFSPSLNAVGPSSSSPVLPASPPQIKRAVPRVKEEPRSPSPPVDRVGCYQEACDLWSSKYMDNILADDGLNLDLKEYLFHPSNSRLVPQEVKNVRPHCLYKSLHPDKGKSTHIQWGKLGNHEKDIWQRISEKIKCRQLRQEREGLVMRRNGRAVAPSVRNTFNPHQMPSWNFPDTRPVPHLYQNVFHN